MPYVTAYDECRPVQLTIDSTVDKPVGSRGGVVIVPEGPLQLEHLLGASAKGVAQGGLLHQVVC